MTNTSRRSTNPTVIVVLSLAGALALTLGTYSTFVYVKYLQGPPIAFANIDSDNAPDSICEDIGEN